MQLESLKHWRHISVLSLNEAGKLIAGIDPTREHLSASDVSLSMVFRRAIVEAVQRANQYAWEYARELDVLLLDSVENAEKIADMRITTDIWETSGRYAEFLPTLEMRTSIGAVLEDPNNVQILLPIDPWYTATVYGGELNDWLARSEISSAYTFADAQSVAITASGENWDAQQTSTDRTPNVVELEAVNAFNERTQVLERPLSTRERNVLLAIIAAVCNEAKIDFKRHSKAAATIKNLSVSMGLNIGESTIEGHLKRIPEALESRSR